MTGFQEAGYIFGQFDELAWAKLALIFAVHLGGMFALFRVAATQPTSFLQRVPMLVTSRAGSLASATALAMIVPGAASRSGGTAVWPPCCS